MVKHGYTVQENDGNFNHVQPYLKFLYDLTEAEKENDVDAVINLKHIADIYGSLKVSLAEGEIIDKLRDLSLVVENHIHEFFRNKIEEMETYDEDAVWFLLNEAERYSKEIRRAAARAQIMITVNSCREILFPGLNITNASALYFDITRVYTDTEKEIFNVLMMHGLYDVIDSLLDPPAQQTQALKRNQRVISASTDNRVISTHDTGNRVISTRNFSKGCMSDRRLLR